MFKNILEQKRVHDYSIADNIKFDNSNLYNSKSLKVFKYHNSKINIYLKK